MAKRWKFIRACLTSIDYTEFNSVDIISINNDFDMTFLDLSDEEIKTAIFDAGTWSLGNSYVVDDYIVNDYFI